MKKILVELPEWQYKEIKGDKGISEGVMINALCAIRLGKLVEQESQAFKWCTDCREYDQEKHCCHRWSKVIRDTVEEMKQGRCDKCEVGNPCLYCKHGFEPQESEET